MRLIEALPVTPSTRMAFVGAGGKSGAMFRLARQALSDGVELILVSASTHLSVDQTGWADHHFVAENHSDLARIDFSTLSGLLLVTGPAQPDGRTEGLPLALMDELLKAPADHEPVVPEWVTEVVVVAGLTGLGQPLTDDHVHRPELFGTLSGIAPGEPVTAEGLAAVLLSESGGLRGIPPGLHCGLSCVMKPASTQ